MLREYEEISPGLIEKLIDMTIAEQDHNHKIDIWEWRYRYIGLFLSFLFFTSLFCGIIWCVYIGAPQIAYGLIAALIFSVIAAIAGHDNISSALKGLRISKKDTD